MTRISRHLGAFVGLALAVSACAPADEPSDNTAVTDPAPAPVGAHVDAQAFAEAASSPGTVLVDIRTLAEIAEGHLPGAVFIDFAAADFRDQLAALDRDASYAVYCRSLNRSRDALATMAELGFSDVVALDGGIIDWANAGGTIVVP